MQAPRLEPMGDQGILARFEDEEQALGWAEALRRLRLPWVLDVVQAYTAVAVFPDPEELDRGNFDVEEGCRLLEHVAVGPGGGAAGRLHVIPCCYDLGPDLARVAAHRGLTPGEVVARHAGRAYTVYAIGFCPGFPYLGYLDETLAGVPRLPSPRVRVEPGSVGLTGRQTGIYPEARPGGWNLIGRTPLVLVDVGDGYFPLRTGDRVQFEPITRAEFAALEGRRLQASPG